MHPGARLADDTTPTEQHVRLQTEGAPGKSRWKCAELRRCHEGKHDQVNEGLEFMRHHSVMDGRFVTPG